MSIQRELNEAAESTSEAESLLSQGRWTESVIRSYEAMHHLARALVYGQDLPDDERRRQLSGLQTLQPRAGYKEPEARLARAQLDAFRKAVEKKLSA